MRKIQSTVHAQRGSSASDIVCQEHRGDDFLALLSHKQQSLDWQLRAVGLGVDLCPNDLIPEWGLEDFVKELHAFAVVLAMHFSAYQENFLFVRMIVGEKAQELMFFADWGKALFAALLHQKGCLGSLVCARCSAEPYLLRLGHELR